MSLAGAADTAALQHSRLPLAYTSRRLGTSQSLPVIRGLPSKLLAPPASTSPLQTAPLLSTGASPLRRSPVFTKPLSKQSLIKPASALRQPLRERVVHTSRLPEPLKTECLAKLDCITGQAVNASHAENWNALLHSEDGSSVNYEMLSVGDDKEDEAVSIGTLDPADFSVWSQQQAGIAKDALQKTGPFQDTVPVQQSGEEQQSLTAANARGNSVPAKLSREPPAGDRGRSGTRSIAEDAPSRRRQEQKRGRSWTNWAESTSSSWRCSDRSMKPGTNRVPIMRATWACRRTVDWDIGWLEPARPASRSRSASPDGERDHHMVLPPMLLSSCEARKAAAASRQAAASAGRAATASDPEVTVKPTSEWRLRSLFENSVKYQVRYDVKS